MRPIALSLLASGALLVPAEGLAHPGHGEFAMVEVGNFAFTPARVQVTTGEEVLWNWVGPDRNHTVTAVDGSFDSDPGRTPGPAGRPADSGFSRQFDTPGQFAYRCKVHEQMQGVVVVDPKPAADPAPVVSNLRAPARARKRMTLRFTLSEPAVVLLEVDRLKPEKLVLSRSRQLPAGPSSIVVRTRSFRPGRYRVQLVPVDGAQNAGAPVRATVRVVR
jgi:plastocyanin